MGQRYTVVPLVGSRSMGPYSATGSQRGIKQTKLYFYAEQQESSTKQVFYSHHISLSNRQPDVLQDHYVGFSVVRGHQVSPETTAYNCGLLRIRVRSA